MRKIVYTLICLFMTVGCRRTALEPHPHENDAVSQKAQAEAKRRPPIEQLGYTQGYENGAKMVLEAAARNRKPFLILLDQPVVAEGSIHALSIEMDPGTGFPISHRGDAPIPGFANGQADGFGWALHTFGTRLVHPSPLPSLPEEWNPWYDGIVLNDGELKVQIFHEGRWLIWLFSRAGFPARQRGHIAEEGWIIHRTALGEGVIWVDTSAFGAVALDIEEGLIRNILPSPPLKVGVEEGVSQEVNGLRSFLEKFLDSLFNFVFKMPVAD